MTESGREIQSLQKLGKTVIAPEWLEERLDAKQGYEICPVIDRFVEALKCQIEIFEPDRGQSFRGIEVNL